MLSSSRCVIVRRMTRIITVLLVLLMISPPLGLSAIGEGEADADGPSGRSSMTEGRLYLDLKAARFDPLFDDPDIPQALMVKETGGQVGRGLFIVQVDGPVKKEWRTELVSTGARILGYIPELSYLVELDRMRLDDVEALSFVRVVIPFHTAFKISPDIWPGEVEGDIEVTIDVHRDMEQVLSKVQGLDGELVSVSDGQIRTWMRSSMIPDLARMEQVLWIEAIPEYRLFNDVSAGIMNVNLTWNTYGLNGSGQIVAVSDSGIDTGINNDSMHDDLEGRITAIVDLWPGAGDGANDTNSGHGTHVAGSVLGNGSRSNGKIKGMAPGASLYFQALERNSDEVFASPTPLNTQIFQPAYTAGARVHTNSWGSSVSDGSYTARSREVDQMVYDNDDMVILFAVSNDGVDSNSDGIVDLDSIDAPATAKNCISVGASESYRPSHGWGYSAGSFPAAPISGDKAVDDPDGMAAFSSRGPTNDNRIKPDIVAPGTGILSLRSSEATETGWGLPSAAEGDSDYYMFNGGTSMATPLAAGTATLVRQYYVDTESISPSAALVKATLINGADDMPGQYASPKNDTGPIWDYNQGWGRINLTNSIFPSPRELIYDDQNHPLDTGENYTYELVVTSSLPFKVSVVWTDPPAAVAANPTLVNDLDLIVTAPNSTVYKGNRFNNGESETGGSADVINNVENVYILSPSTGKFRIEVNASNVPTGPQSYAIVFSGVFSAPPPSVPTLNAPSSGAYTNARPTFNITADDVNNDDLMYRIELSKDDFSTIYRTMNQTLDSIGWSKPIYASGEDALYTVKVGEELEDGVRYYWRALAWDGTNWSSASAIRNLTVDAEPPSALSISINTGDNSTNSLSVTLGLSATDDDSGLSGGLSAMSFSDDGTSWSSWESYAVSKIYNLEDYQGLHRVYFRARDSVGNIADGVSSTIIYDDVRPTGLTVSISHGTVYSNTTTVDLALSASDATSGLGMMAFSNDGALWSSWEQFGSKKVGWDLTDVATGGNANDGVKTVHFRVKDHADNIANPVSSSITMDTTEPQGVSVLINGGDLYATARLVHITIDGTDILSGISHMSIDVNGAGYGPWEPFASSKFISLPGGSGDKTIAVKLMDRAGNTASEVQATINLDLEAPDALTITASANATNDRFVTFVLSAMDTGSGLDEMSFSFDGNIWTAWEPWTTTKDLMLPEGEGTKTVYMRVRDNAGNIGGPVSARTTLDTEGPMFDVTVNGGAKFTGSVDVEVKIRLLEGTGSYEISDYQVSFSNEGVTWSPFTSLTGIHSWALSNGDGKKTVYVVVEDPVGNQLQANSEAIILDTTSPMKAVLVLNGGDEYSTSSMVTCALQATDDNGLSLMSFSLDGQTWSALETWSGTRYLDLGHYNGPRTVHVKMIDPAGNEVIVQDTIILDEDIPEIYSMRINNATDDMVPYARQTVVFFSLSSFDEGTNISEMSFGFDGITWGPWKNYTEEGHIRMPNVDGTVSVYVRIRDHAGNIAEPEMVMVILDTKAPESVSLVINGDAYSTTESMVNIRISAIDITSGLDQYRYKEGDGAWSNWHPFTTSRSVRLSEGAGEKTIHLEVRDKAGNIAPEVTDTIELKDTASTSPELSVRISNPGGETVKGSVRLTGSVAGGTPSSLEIRFDGGEWVPLDSRASWSYNWDTTKVPDGAHIVEVRAGSGQSTFNSGPVVFNVKNKADTVNQGSSGIDATSLLIYIIIGAVVGAAAGGGVAAAMRPKQPPPSAIDGPRAAPRRKKELSEEAPRRRGAAAGAGYEEGYSDKYGYGENPICATCGHPIDDIESPVICQHCGRTYHEECASSMKGYCEECGQDLY